MPPRTADTMLGLYDSGLGGLTVLAALRETGVAQDVVYFADQAHVPYGDRTDRDLYRLLSENFRLLDGYGVDAIVMACNTSCAVAARCGGFPSARGPVLDLIANAASALRTTSARSIAVFATAATVRSGAYARAIAAAAPHVDVREIAAPALVPLVESGRSMTAQARDAVRELCERLDERVDAVVYGCTHYPMLDAHFAEWLASGVTRIDPALAQATAARELVERLRLPAERGVTHYLTNGDLATFRRSVIDATGDRTGTFAVATVLAS